IERCNRGVLRIRDREMWRLGENHFLLRDTNLSPLFLKDVSRQMQIVIRSDFDFRARQIRGIGRDRFAFGIEQDELPAADLTDPFENGLYAAPASGFPVVRCDDIAEAFEAVFLTGADEALKLECCDSARK